MPRKPSEVPTVTFWGAARTVTGSMHRVDANGRTFLLDGRLYQAHRVESRERNLRFPFRPKDVDAVNRAAVPRLAHRPRSPLGRSLAAMNVVLMPIIVSVLALGILILALGVGGSLTLSARTRRAGRAVCGRATKSALAAVVFA